MEDSPCRTKSNSYFVKLHFRGYNTSPYFMVDEKFSHFSTGSSRSSWSCYFFPETSQECRNRAFELMKEKEVWEKGIITRKGNYTTKVIWTGRVPR